MSSTGRTSMPAARCRTLASYLMFWPTLRTPGVLEQRAQPRERRRLRGLRRRRRGEQPVPARVRPGAHVRERDVAGAPGAVASEIPTSSRDSISSPVVSVSTATVPASRAMATHASPARDRSPARSPARPVRARPPARRPGRRRPAAPRSAAPGSGTPGPSGIPAACPGRAGGGASPRCRRATGTSRRRVTSRMLTRASSACRSSRSRRFGCGTDPAPASTSSSDPNRVTKPRPPS